MKYATVNGERQEAKPSLSGECIGCGHPMIAKCGEVKIAHWAHRSKRVCDTWWENETEWHRTWKGHFPVEWQEVVHHAEDGEKHISDVKTQNGWVLEFQHSFLNPEERRARSAFYPKLVWIVDATRRERDKTQFNKALEMGTRVLQKPAVLVLNQDHCALLREWGGLDVPVFFDFGEAERLWCLLPVNSDGRPYIIMVSRKQFVDLHRSTETLAAQNFEMVLKEFGNLISSYLLRKKQEAEWAAIQNTRLRNPDNLLRQLGSQNRYRRRF